MKARIAKALGNMAAWLIAVIVIALPLFIVATIVVGLYRWVWAA